VTRNFDGHLVSLSWVAPPTFNFHWSNSEKNPKGMWHFLGIGFTQAWKNIITMWSSQVIMVKWGIGAFWQFHVFIYYLLTYLLTY